MTASLDELLANAVIPTSAASFDVAAGLRRLADEASPEGPPPEVVRAAQARAKLSVVCQWALKAPGASGHVERLASSLSTDELCPTPDGDLDLEGALVFACMLYQSGQPEGAQFWWQLAAGAGHALAAYALNQYHLVLGETREAQHWYHQALSAVEDASVTNGRVETFLSGLGAVAMYVGRTTPAGRTSQALAAEITRLASGSSYGIVSPPDQRLVEELTVQLAGDSHS